MLLYIAKSGDLDRCYRCLTDRLTTLKDRATQLLKKYKSGALVTQIIIIIIVTEIISKAASGQIKAFVGKFRELWAAL